MCCYTNNALLDYKSWCTLYELNNNIYKKDHKDIVDATYSKHQEWWKGTIQVFFNLRNLSTIGVQSIDSAKKRTSYDSDKEDRFSILYNAFGSNPAIYDTLSRSIGYNSLLFAEASFAKENNTSSSEITLTERLLNMIGTAGAVVAKNYESSNANKEHFSISKIDFQTKNREKHIGADFALIIESRDCNGLPKFTPIIFQAKMARNSEANISYRSKKSEESQFETLCKQNNGYYIFYPSGDDMETLPSVKSVKKIDPMERRTSTVNDVIALSTLYLDIVSNTSDNYQCYNNRNAMLESIYTPLVEGDISSLLVISEDENSKTIWQKIIDSMYIEPRLS